MAETSPPFLQMHAAPPSPGRAASRVTGLLIGLLLLALAGAAIWWRFIAHSGLIFGATVDGHRAVLTAKAEGLVTEVRAALNQVVNAGQPLLFMSPLSGMNAGAGDWGAIEAMRERVAVAERAEKAAREELEMASLEHVRRQLALRAPVKGGSGSEESRQERDRLRSEERRARAALEAAKDRAEAASLTRQSVENLYRQLREPARRAQIEATQPDLGQAVMTAPMFGKISSLEARPGAQVAPGQTLAVIDPVQPDQLWVTGFIRPGNVTRLRPGKTLALRFPGHSQALTGQVDAIQENFSQKDLPGIPVRIRISGYDPLTMPALSIGQKVDVREQ